MKKSPAYYWTDWLVTSLPGKKISNKNIKQFKNAQENLWQALNIYDDFLDGVGQPASLPEANRAYRNFLKVLYSSNLPKSFQKISDTILNNLDLANQQEIRDNKIMWKNKIPKLPKNIPDFNQLINLSKKSLALAILPIAAVLINNKLKERRLINFFSLALAAKQLSDDAKDWLDDLRAGKLTAVNFLVIQEGLNQKINKSLYQKTEVLHLLFVLGAAIPTCQRILQLCQEARNEAYKLNIKEQAPILRGLIAPLEKAAHKALRFQALLSE